MTRPDLRALTPASLVALANRGLVKRAVKELDAGAAPVLDLSEEGALHGRFPDGSEAVLPADVGFDGARCSYGAIGTCRHRVGLVLAYQRRYPAGELVVTSPGEITDEELAAAFGNRALTAARRVHRAGYSARIRRPSADDPVAEVELPACTVRFLVPGELGYVHTEASDAKREQTIVLALWAFRAADESMPEVPELRLDVGGTGTPTTSGLESTLELVDKLLLDGAADAGPVLVARLERLHAELEAAQLRWPAAAVAELAEQLGFHRARSAHYRPRRFAELLTELHARHRAALSGASPRSRVLGTDEPGETPLRRVRLTSLGCRISGVPGERRAEVYFADARTASVLVLQRTWTVADGEKRTGADLADERVNGTSLLALASSNVVSESAYRSASRLLRLASARVAQTTTTPIGDSWARLPDALLVRDYRAFAAEIAALPPHLIRPRVAAELVRVVHIAEVRQVTYHPGDQRLDAEIADAHGATATIRAHYSEYRPGALDALATALTSGPRYVSGALHQAHGTLVVDPIAVPTDPTPTDHAPTHPAPTRQGPANSGPAHRAPTHPAPIHSDLIHQAPVDSGPTDRAPTDSAPTHAGPPHPAPIHRGPAHSGSTGPAPTHAGATDSGPTDRGPTDGGQTHSGLTNPALIHPDLTPSDAHVPLPTTPTTSPPDAITVALDLLATTAHHGLRHATSPIPAVAGDAFTQAVTALASAGYPAAASALAAFADSCNTGTELTRTWLAAYLRLSLTSPPPLTITTAKPEHCFEDHPRIRCTHATKKNSYHVNNRMKNAIGRCLMLTQVADGVLVHQSELLQNNSVVVQGNTGVLVVDPGITGSEMACLVNDIRELDQTVVAGFSTHPDWDHALWHPELGDAPRYGTARCAEYLRDLLSNADWKTTVAEGLPPEIADEVPLDLFGLITGLPAGTTQLPWDGPRTRIIEHPAHAQGHAALVIEERGVLVAGDMLSDILFPFPDLGAANPLEDYLTGLRVLDDAADDIDVLIPGHGSVGRAEQVRARIEQDREYVQALRDDRTPDDPRIGPSATYGKEWLPAVYEWQRQQLAGK